MGPMVFRRSQSVGALERIEIGGPVTDGPLASQNKASGSGSNELVDPCGDGLPTPANRIDYGPYLFLKTRDRDRHVVVTLPPNLVDFHDMALRANNGETSTPRKFTLEGVR